ncbi:MAG TPA: DUF3106 domain-containing protein [Burkholderiales bacterium]|nr:DUF3106 domain-containing protein [Burkholderiales bacterium]
MKTSSQIVVGLTASVLSFTGFHMNSVSHSVELSGDEKKVLFPLVDSWKSLPDDERERLLQVARDYRSLSPEMQHRVSDRLLTWTMLGSAERSAARDQYRKFRALPPDKRRALINKWKKQHLG